MVLLLSEGLMMSNKIWLLTWATKPADVEWDFYRSVVVVAADEMSARGTHPLAVDPGQVDASGWGYHEGWAEEPSGVSAMLLGEAAAGVGAGVVCSDFVSAG